MKPLAAVLVVLALALAGVGAWHAEASPGTAETGAPAAASSCGFYASDGDATAIVLATGDVCETLAAGLAADGAYWAPFAGANPGPSAPLCSLSSGGSAITVYDPAAAEEPVTGGVAKGVCAGEEANGWLPA